MALGSGYMAISWLHILQNLVIAQRPSAVCAPTELWLRHWEGKPTNKYEHVPSYSTRGVMPGHALPRSSTAPRPMKFFIGRQQRVVGASSQSSSSLPLLHKTYTTMLEQQLKQNQGNLPPLLQHGVLSQGC